MAEKVSIIIFSDELDKACAAFNVAIGSAASGMDVVLFFTCWGVNIVKKEGPLIRGDNLMNKLINFMTRGGAHKLSPSKFNVFGLGGWMMRRMMAEEIQSIPEMIEEARALGVRFLVCDHPMNLMGLKREDLIDEVEKIVGVATYVKEASESKINLVF
ncbi:MAG: DsrE/DsrF/DrsH-like family protein [Candidatus Hydrothermarchaeales archaeon]